MLLLAAVATACSTPTPSQPSESLSPSEVASASSTFGTAPIPDATSVVYHFDSPFPWSTLPVTGRLLFITYDPQASTTSMPVPLIALLDLATGDVTAVWRPPENAWLSGMDLAPDRTKLAIAYASPPEDGNFQSGRPGVYLLPGDCLARGVPTSCRSRWSKPRKTIPTSGPFGPRMERACYFSHLTTPPDTLVSAVSVERVPAAGGTPELLIPNATWPRPSPDGTTLAYVAFDSQLNINDLYFAAARRDERPAGDASRIIPVRGRAGVLARWGVHLLQRRRGLVRSRRSGEPWPDHRTWLERLTGVQPAYANGMPSEWWRLPVAGGDPTRLSAIGASGLSGAFSPDGRFFGFISYSGMGMMSAEGNASPGSIRGRRSET